MLLFYCKGWTPLMAAAYKGNGKIVKSFIKHGANVNDKNKLGKFFIQL